MMRQTAAIFIDAYRELNHKKMFWISLGISALVVSMFAALGINERGITILWWQLDIPVNTAILSPSFFYKFLFLQFGVNLWITFGAMGLALVSTASTFPDMVTAGSIELVLSRPISRVRYFFTRFLCSMLFVFLQTLLFAVLAFAVIGLRGGQWIWAVFATVPVALLMFSYLFSISVLVGVVTRSTVAAVLSVALFWPVAALVVKAEHQVLEFVVSSEMTLDRQDHTIADRTAQLALERPRTEAKQEGAMSPERIKSLGDALVRANESREQTLDSLATRKAWHRLMYAGYVFVPKTGETVDLLTRILRASGSDFVRILERELPIPENKRNFFADTREARAAEYRAEEIILERSLWFVVGTSIAFEMVVLGAAAWIFCRRDF
ncbi:hypothetical protein BH11PLA1_BH11PLA1_05460 [soil metagenome]